MHQYIEMIRKEIESVAGQETYLMSSLFLRMHLAFRYEDEGLKKLNSRDEFELIQNKAITSISGQYEFDLKTEILSWQAAILRDVANDFYLWWMDFKEKRFMAPNSFNDGEKCLTLEAVCEKLKVNPTEVYTTLLEIEHVMTRLNTSCNIALLEIDKYWLFKYHNQKKAPENEFMNKRIALEQKNTIMFNSIELLENVSSICRRFASKLAGAQHLLWMTPHNMMEALIVTLRGFLNFEYTEDAELSFKKWLDALFPQKLTNGYPNPYFQSPLHHKIVERLSQATQCMVQETIHKNNAFEQRDSIVRPFITDLLENVKGQRLQELQGQLNSNRTDSAIH